jgi:hypothetical protein
MLKILATNTVVAGVFTILMALHAGWDRVPSRFLISLLYAGLIGTAAQRLLPRVGACSPGAPAAVFWMRMGAALLALAVAGGALAGLVAAALGLMGPWPAWAAQRHSLGVAVVITMSAGIVLALHETTRARLDRARARTCAPVSSNASAPSAWPATRGWHRSSRASTRTSCSTPSPPSPERCASHRSARSGC